MLDPRARLRVSGMARRNNEDAPRMALTRQNAGALTVLGAAVCLVFGFFGFAVAVPGSPL